MWEKIYDDSENGNPALYRYTSEFTFVEVKFNLHIGSPKKLNWYCSDHTGNNYLTGTNKNGYKTLLGAQQAAVRCTL